MTVGEHGLRHPLRHRLHRPLAPHRLHQGRRPQPGRLHRQEPDLVRRHQARRRRSRPRRASPCSPTRATTSTCCASSSSPPAASSSTPTAPSTSAPTPSRSPSPSSRSSTTRASCTGRGMERLDQRHQQRQEPPASSTRSGWSARVKSRPENAGKYMVIPTPLIEGVSGRGQRLQQRRLQLVRLRLEPQQGPRRRLPEVGLGDLDSRHPRVLQHDPQGRGRHGHLPPQPERAPTTPPTTSSSTRASRSTRTSPPGWPRSPSLKYTPNYVPMRDAVAHATLKYFQGKIKTDRRRDHGRRDRVQAGDRAVSSAPAQHGASVTSAGRAGGGPRRNATRGAARG